MQEAAGALGALLLPLGGSAARRGELISAFSRLAKDDVWSVRRACADALGAAVAAAHSGFVPGAALPLVLALCRDPSSWVRGAALRVTGTLLAVLPSEDCTQGGDGELHWHLHSVSSSLRSFSLFICYMNTLDILDTFIIVQFMHHSFRVFPPFLLFYLQS